MSYRNLTRHCLAATLVLAQPLGVAFGAQTGQNAVPPAAPVEGVWMTTSQTELTIAPCSDGYCGYISKIVVPEDIKQQYGDQLNGVNTAQFTDANNKDPKLRGRPIQGLQILTLRATGDPKHYEGDIYNPQDGNIYSGAVDVLSADQIKLKGCWMYVLCQEQQWNRVPPPLPVQELAGH